MPAPTSTNSVINPFGFTNYAINTAPSIGGITTITNINDAAATATPFSKTTLTDNDLGAMLTVAIRLDTAAKGAFTAQSLIASGFSSADGGLTYTHAAGTPAQLQAAIQMLVYQPTANRVAVDSTETTTFTISVSDGIAPPVSNNSTTVVSTSINDIPVAINDTLTTIEDTPVIYTAMYLLGNDIDADGNPLTIAAVTSGSGGRAVLSADGYVTFIPDSNFNGVASFTYTTSDGMSISNSATVTVNVASVNDIPIAADDILTAIEDTAITYSVATLLNNDFDVESPLTIASITNGTVVMVWNYNWDTWEYITYSTGGTAVLNPNGTITFTPDNNFNGLATFTYAVSDGTSISNSATVTINVASVNDAPIVNNDIFAAIEDAAIVYSVADLLANDVDVDGNPLSLVDIASGTGGTVLLSDDRTTLIFTPTANFNGIANFTYTISDGVRISNSGTVTVNVADVNDAPVAINDTLTATQNTELTYSASDLLANDTDIDGNSLTIASVTNGTGGTVLLSDDHTTLTFTPNTNFKGVADFTYTVSDSIDTSNSATVMINVMPIKDTLIAVNDTLSSIEDTAVTYNAINLLDNDIHADGKSLTITTVTNGEVTMVWNYNQNAWESVTTSTGGTATLNPDGTVTFVPDNNFNGVASFTYTASDSTNTSNSATVTVNVAAVNDAPVAINDTLTATKNTVAIYSAADLLANDTDIDSNSLTIASVTNGKGGKVVLSADHTTLTFTPDTNFNGVADFTYKVSDGTNTSNSAAVTVNVASALTINVINFTDFKLGTGIDSTTGVDKLDLASTSIAAGTDVVNGIDAGVIHSHSICNGIISFDDVDSYTTPFTITAEANLASVLDYLQANIIDNNTVAFISEGNTFVFQDGGVTDTIVELVGVTASSINTSGLAAGSIWLV